MVVAMSRMTGGSSPAGIPTASGFVPSRASTPPQIAIWLALATAEYKPIMPCSTGMEA
jgi:hypothetical protein